MKASIALLSAPLIDLLLGVLMILPSASAELVQRGEVQDAIPSECAETCSVVSTALETCDYGDCFCTNSTAQGLEDCMSCLYEISPVSSVYDAVQGALSEFDQTCNSFINDISLTIPGPGRQVCMIINRNSLIRRNAGALSSSAHNRRGSYSHRFHGGLAAVHIVLALSLS